MIKRLFTSLLLIVICVSAAKADTETCISGTRSPKDFPLATPQITAGIYYDPADDVAVLKAIRSFRDDVRKVSGRSPQLAVGQEMPKYPVIVGTLGKSKVIDRLARRGVIDKDNLAGKWETFIIKVADAPAEGVERALIVAGSDRRGTIYGLYELSRQMGVSPWYWWLDAPVREMEEIYVRNVDLCSGEPAVKYRGIFINDEFPSMTSWAKHRFGGMNSEMYAHVYELLLRLKANCLWPAMWGSFKEYRPLVPIFKDENGYFEGNCFNEDDPLNPRVADEYGIVIGTSHHEPMQRSQQEWIRHKKDYGNGEWNYQTNGTAIERFFAEGIRHTKDYESIITIGMRGDEDAPMADTGSPESNFRLMQKIIGRQRRIIEKETGKKASATPQVWTLYSEVLDYYDQGLEIPDDVIIMFCDDNFGNVRRLPDLSAPRHKGGYGMYYHVSYYGAPRACKWLNTFQIQQLWQQLRLTYDYGVDRMWMLNVGDIKPHEFPIDFFMEMAWDPNAFTESNLMDYTERFCGDIFGKEYGKDAAEVLDSYNRYAAWIQPELLDATTYNMADGEYEHLADKWLALEARASRLEKRLPEDCRDAWRQLLGYPVEGIANLYDMYYNLARHHAACRDSDPDSGRWAEKVKECFVRDSLLTYHYNNTMSGGKWCHMMDQPHIGYYSWHDPQHNTHPQLHATASMATAEGGYVFPDTAGRIVMDADHFHSCTAEMGKWTFLPGLGRWRGGLTLSIAPGEAPSGSLDYRFSLSQPSDSVDVTVIAMSTMPFVKGGHYISLALDGGSPETVGLNQKLNWEHKYDLMYPTGASRVIVSTRRLALGDKANGGHTVTVRPGQDGIVLYKVVIDTVSAPINRVWLPETPHHRIL